MAEKTANVAQAVRRICGMVMAVDASIARGNSRARATAYGRDIAGEIGLQQREFNPIGGCSMH
jgi:hypothetical protein